MYNFRDNDFIKKNSSQTIVYGTAEKNSLQWVLE